MNAQKFFRFAGAFVIVTAVLFYKVNGVPLGGLWLVDITHLAVLASSAPVNEDYLPLPTESDYVVSPDPSLPTDVRAWSGKWLCEYSDRMKFVRRAFLLVRKISYRASEGVYSADVEMSLAATISPVYGMNAAWYGPAPAAHIEGNRLWIDLPDVPSAYTWSMNGDGRSAVGRWWASSVKNLGEGMAEALLSWGECRKLDASP